MLFIWENLLCWRYSLSDFINIMTVDTIILNDWYAVAISEEVSDGDKFATQLLGEDILVWRSKGEIHTWLDRCPHRGSKLSLGEIRNKETVVCAYHGWHFNSDGRCIRMPAHPDQNISERAEATQFRVQERYGLVWVCLGEPVSDVPEFHGLDDDYHLVITGPYDVGTSGPRAVENFLDLSHFPFIHTGYLGEEPYTEMDDYDVEIIDNEIRVTNATVYQPRANINSEEGVKVVYSYRVLRPLVVMLTKEPGANGGKPTDIILMVNMILGDEYSSVADLNGDGSLNVQDIVLIVNSILESRSVDATRAELSRTPNQLLLLADGFIGGVEMTLKHGSDFNIDLTSDAMVADYRTIGSETKLVIVVPESEELFTYTGDFEITDMIIANSEDIINVVNLAETPSEGMITEYSLGTAYPNPFNPTTSLTLAVPEAGNVSVQVYNIMGQVVATLASGYMEANTSTPLTWDASNVSSGMYFVKAEANGFVTTQKLLLMK